MLVVIFVASALYYNIRIMLKNWSRIVGVVLPTCSRSRMSQSFTAVKLALIWIRDMHWASRCVFRVQMLLVGQRLPQRPLAVMDHQQVIAALTQNHCSDFCHCVTIIIVLVYQMYFYIRFKKKTPVYRFKHYLYFVSIFLTKRLNFSIHPFFSSTYIDNDMEKSFFPRSTIFGIC